VKKLEINCDARSLLGSNRRYKMLLDYYKAIEESSLNMLNAAKIKDWDAVVRFEGACAVLIEQLRDRANHEELLPAQKSEKTKIMQRILKNDAQIRYLAEPWLEHCDQKFDSDRQFLH
jgi:flagellar protein FliT